MSSILLQFLMVIRMVGIIFFEIGFFFPRFPKLDQGTLFDNHASNTSCGRGQEKKAPHLPTDASSARPVSRVQHFHTLSRMLGCLGIIIIYLVKWK